jgi:dCMP deaminase
MGFKSFADWMKQYRRLERVMKHEDGRSFTVKKPFNHLDVLNVDLQKPFFPPPPKVATFEEAHLQALAALDRAEKPWEKKVLVEEGPRAYFVSEREKLEKNLFDSLSPEAKQRIIESDKSAMNVEEDVRPSWPETWMSVARAMAKRSYDPRLQVGAIIVSDDNTRMLSVGYNGNYKGGPNEAESGVPGQSGMIHAEQNAIIKCDFNFHKKKHMYLTHSPCRTCAKFIINAEISRVVYENVYRDQAGIDLLKSVSVEVFSLEEAILNAKSCRS